MILNKRFDENETILFIFVISITTHFIHLTTSNVKKISFDPFFNLHLFLFWSAKHEFGFIKIHCDKRINQLVEVEKRIDQIQGYRIQICFDSDKNEADRVRGKFLKLFPLTDTYMVFENPHFNLKVGDYRSEMEAEKIKREIFGEFVISIIHEELVNLPRID